MSGGELDLDAIEAHVRFGLEIDDHNDSGNTHVILREDVPALVAEVRRLRALVERAEALGAIKALEAAAHALDLGQTEPHTREDRIGAAGAPDWLRERATRINVPALDEPKLSS